MDLIEHEKACKERFGEPHTEVHVFLDSYSWKYKGQSHRRILHHELGAKLCEARFGEVAGMAARLHIEQDLGLVPGDWTGYEEHFFPLGDEEERQREDLLRIYGEETVERIEGKKEWG